MPLRITRLTIQNIGPHADVTFAFSPGHNLIVGTNGSGKSTVLRAISLALTGTCHLTDKRGRGFERLIRTGAAESSISLTLDPHGTVQRTRSAKKHKLTLSWADGDKVSDNETRLLDALQLPAETIWAMFDPIPVLERPIEDQRAALLRVLRPAKITVPQSLLDAGIPTISGIEHIESLLKDHKEVTLRDLNREAKSLDDHPPEEPGEEPEGVNLDARLKLLDGLNAKFVALTKELQTVSSAIGMFEERIRRAEQAGPRPTAEQSEALTKAIIENAENLKAARETEAKISGAIQTGMNLLGESGGKYEAKQALLRSICQRMAELSERPKIKCPADACPLIERLVEQADTEILGLESQQAQLTSECDEITTDRNSLALKTAKHQESLAVAIKARQTLELKSGELRELNTEANRLAAIHTEADTARNSLDEARARRDKISSDIEKCQQLRDTHTTAVEGYREWQAKAEAVRKWRDNVAA
jgi:DNA repair exonuclease SbcCD ATPase subunit